MSHLLQQLHTEAVEGGIDAVDLLVVRHRVLRRCRREARRELAEVAAAEAIRALDVVPGVITLGDTPAAVATLEGVRFDELRTLLRGVNSNRRLPQAMHSSA